jgi:hypothetical protein
LFNYKKTNISLPSVNQRISPTCKSRLSNLILTSELCHNNTMYSRKMFSDKKKCYFKDNRTIIQITTTILTTQLPNLWRPNMGQPLGCIVVMLDHLTATILHSKDSRKAIIPLLELIVLFHLCFHLHQAIIRIRCSHFKITQATTIICGLNSFMASQAKTPTFSLVEHYFLQPTRISINQFKPGNLPKMKIKFYYSIHSNYQFML